MSSFPPLRSDTAGLSLLFSPPFHQAKTHNDLANQLRSKRIPPLPRKVSSELTRAIARMLEFEPKNRPSATELLNYPRMQAVQYKRWKEAQFVPPLHSQEPNRAPKLNHFFVPAAQVESLYENRGSLTVSRSS